MKQDQKIIKSNARNELKTSHSVAAPSTNLTNSSSITGPSLNDISAWFSPSTTSALTSIPRLPMENGNSMTGPSLDNISASIFPFTTNTSPSWLSSFPMENVPPSANLNISSSMTDSYLNSSASSHSTTHTYSDWANLFPIENEGKNDSMNNILGNNQNKKRKIEAGSPSSNGLFSPMKKPKPIPFDEDLNTLETVAMNAKNLSFEALRQAQTALQLYSQTAIFAQSAKEQYERALTSEEQWLQGVNSYKEGTQKEAVRLFRLSSAQGNPKAVNSLGFCYMNGIGIEQDRKEALRLYRIAANQGLSFALYNLACCYRDGRGVDKDGKEAVRFFRLAAEQGHPRAQYLLGRRYLSGDGDGVDKNPKEAISLFRLTADNGYQPSIKYLIGLYEKGFEGLKKDPNEAEYFKKILKKTEDSAAGNNPNTSP